MKVQSKARSGTHWSQVPLAAQKRPKKKGDVQLRRELREAILQRDAALTHNRQLIAEIAEVRHRLAELEEATKWTTGTLEVGGQSMTVRFRGEMFLGFPEADIELQEAPKVQWAQKPLDGYEVVNVNLEEKPEPELCRWSDTDAGWVCDRCQTRKSPFDTWVRTCGREGDVPPILEDALRRRR